MAVWAIADLHLSFGVSGKEMDLFGEEWHKHYEKIEARWREVVTEEDLVLLAGDISWAVKLEDAIPDFEWIASLPGTKVMIKGNHDYWWSSLSKVQKALPFSLHAIQNNMFSWNDIEVAGTRLWDSDFTFDPFIVYRENPKENISAPIPEKKENERIFAREVERLKLSLHSFRNPDATRIVMTHYPPLDADLHPNRVTDLLEEHHVSYCVFGHLHSVRPGSLPFGKRGGVEYILTSCDYLHFTPRKII